MTLQDKILSIIENYVTNSLGGYVSFDKENRVALAREISERLGVDEKIVEQKLSKFHKYYPYYLLLITHYLLLITS